jgi:hypothetical protein
MAIEHPTYTVIRHEGDYELRQYEPLIVAVSTEDDLRGSSGFSNIFDYIQGNNATRQKIAMTVPVINEMTDESMTTAFVMPKAYNLSTLPQPQSKRLTLHEKPARIVATVRFSGNVKARIIAQHAAKLQTWIAQLGYFAVGSIELARYNPPFIPGFLKRNEVWLEVQHPQ